MTKTTLNIKREGALWYVHGKGGRMPEFGRWATKEDALKAIHRFYVYRNIAEQPHPHGLKTEPVA